DAHVHLASVPGSMIRGDTEEQLREQRRLQLRALLASGVTSVLDCAVPEEMLRELRAQATDGHPSPTVFALGPFLTPAEGYFGTAEQRHSPYDALEAPIADPAEVEPLMALATKRPTRGAKVTFEDGLLFSIWPEFDRDTRFEIRDAAKRHDVRVYAHSLDNDAHRQALETEPYALVHAGMGSEALEPDVLEAIRASGAYVITTAAIYELENWTRERNWTEQSWIKARVPERQWVTALDPDIEARVTGLAVPIVSPWWMPNAWAEVFSGWIRDSDSAHEELESSLRAIKALHDAGVPLVLGSDTGNWPAFATFFHGVGAVVEAELLERAGLPRLEIIRAATRRAAAMLDVDTLGAVEVGMTADLVLYPRDPLSDGMRVLREPAWVVSRGEARTPAGWLTGGLRSR
ncbi:MAG: amidohydrolase family protein, partial [Myxococcota bacterium]